MQNPHEHTVKLYIKPNFVPAIGPFWSGPKHYSESKYRPHQGAQERARRGRQKLRIIENRRRKMQNQ